MPSNGDRCDNCGLAGHWANECTQQGPPALESSNECNGSRNIKSTSADFAAATKGLNDLISEKVNGRVLFATDEFFASADNLLKASPPLWIADKFTDCGKWMDGWESRRKRIAGHDWSVIELGLSGSIWGIHVDTAYFTGNFTPRVSIQAACIDQALPFGPRGEKYKFGVCATPQEIADADKALSQYEWTELVPMTPLGAGYETSTTRHSYFVIPEGLRGTRYTHVRLNMYPDGGIARMHVYGKVARDWAKVSTDALIDLVAVENGGEGLSCSDAHYGSASNLIGMGRSETMADGWETARKSFRPPVIQADPQGNLQIYGSDWAIVRLAHLGKVCKVDIDTNHFKGNFPESCILEGTRVSSDAELEKATWHDMIGRAKLSAHCIQHFDNIANIGPISHVRLTIYPDGGVSRLRLWGNIVRE